MPQLDTPAPGTTVGSGGMPGYATPSNGGFGNIQGAYGAKPPMSPTQSAFSTQNSAYTNQADPGNPNSNYNQIMQGYRNLSSSVQPGGSNAPPNFNYNVNIPTYQTTSDYRNAINNLSSLSQNGGYTPQAIADLRARGVAPIRAAYGNAQNDIARQRTLQGGYSPNFTAASAKMAREMSSQMADQVTNVNAGIAQNQAQNELSASVPLASTTAGEQANRNQFGLEAANMGNQYGLAKLNAQMQGYEIPIQTQLASLQGMNQLYGTTPATTNMTGNNALNIAGLQENIRQNNIRNGMTTASLYGGA
jgi:hypothetical protein